MEETTNDTHDSPRPVVGQSTNTRGQRKRGKSILIVVIVLLVLFGIGGGVWYLLREPEIEVETSPKSLSAPEVTRSTPTSTPSPTPLDVNREEVSIEVLNGTGIAGEASFLQGELEELGYEDIEVGNASSQDNEITKVTFSSKLPDPIVKEITEKLEELYKKVDTDTSSSQKVDVSVITGLRSGQTLPTDTPKATSIPTPTEADSVSITPTPTPSE